MVIKGQNGVRTDKGKAGLIKINDFFGIGDPMTNVLKTIQYDGSLFSKGPSWFMNIVKTPNTEQADTTIYYTDGKIKAVSGNNAFKKSGKDPSFDAVKQLFQKAWDNSIK